MDASVLTKKTPNPHKINLALTVLRIKANISYTWIIYIPLWFMRDLQSGMLFVHYIHEWTTSNKKQSYSQFTNFITTGLHQTSKQYTDTILREKSMDCWASSMCCNRAKQQKEKCKEIPLPIYYILGHQCTYTHTLQRPDTFTTKRSKV